MGRRYIARSAFTLIEVLIVIAIIVALSGLVGLALFSKQKEAKVGLAQTELSTISSALKNFHVKFDRWPTDQEGLEVLWSKDKLEAEADATKWSKELEKPMPLDKWGRAWNYRQVSEHGDADEFDLWSVGPDGEDGTADDIVSWTKEDTGPGGGESGTGGGSSNGSPRTGG